MCVLDRVCEKRGEIYGLAGKHKAEKLWVFGSLAGNPSDNEALTAEFAKKPFPYEKRRSRLS